MRTVFDTGYNESVLVSIAKWDHFSDVVLSQNKGSMSFRHAMTPAQARQLAAYLAECADLLEQRQMPEGVPV